MKISLKLSSFFSLLILSLFFSACAPSKPHYEQLLGTICVVNLFNDGNEELYNEIFARLEQIDSEFTTEKKYSDISRVNERAYVEPVTVGEDIYTVTETAQIISKLTDGAFDISVNPLVSLWQINSPKPHVATKDEIEKLLPLVNYENVVLNYVNKSIHFLEEGMSLDFGGIVKGYAADEIIKICQQHKVKKAVIDLGGNIYIYGKKGKDKLWNVGIKNPERPDSIPLLKISLPQTSVVTSGVYERHFKDGQHNYHHILSPKNGFPCENGLSSVTVICNNSIIADALATAFFVLGKEKSIEKIPYIKSMLNLNFSVIFFDNKHHITFSSDFPYEYKILYEGWQVTP